MELFKITLIKYPKYRRLCLQKITVYYITQKYINNFNTDS